MDANKGTAFPALVRHAGLTLVEFMVSLALSMFVVAAATSLLLASKSAYTTNDDAAVIQEDGRHVLEIIARALRQAGYEDWDGIARLTSQEEGADILGLDARSLKSSSVAMESPLTKTVNGSDVLGIRFHGAGPGEHGDGSILNCAGFGVGAGLKKEGPDERGWSIFFVAEDATGEPELRCKYQGKSGWTAVAIARGVESFQVLYGLDGNEDGVPDHFLTATRLNQLDDSLVLRGADGAARALDKNRKTFWKKVVAVKVALLLRGAHAVRADNLDKTYDLCGEDYGNAYETIDAGTRIREAALPLTSRNRIRKVFSSTIMLRNHGSGGLA